MRGDEENVFTGIIEEVGSVIAVRKGTHSAVLEICADHILEDVHLGDSIAVNGVCLTATSFQKNRFTADVMHETLNRSSLSDAKPGKRVNLERAMLAGGRFGGHMVSGHIDGTGRIEEIWKDDNAVWYTIQASSRLLRYIVEKGSIAIDGISLTVAKVGTTDFSVSIIPHTAQVTTLGERKRGDLVNLETDLIGKYVERLLTTENGASKTDQADEAKGGTNGGGLTREFLEKYGF